MISINPPKILFLTHVGQPGGAEFVMLRLCASVRDNCSVLHFSHGVLEEILSKNYIQSSVLPMPDTLTGLKRSGGWKSLIKTAPAVLSMIWGLARKEKDFDIVVAMSQKSFIIAALAKIIARKPIIWFMNDLISPDHFSKALIFVMTKVFAPFADKIVLNSQASFDAWKNSGGAADKAIIIYPGSDVAAIDAQINDAAQISAYRQKFGGNDTTPLIGIFGRISHWKGQDVFIKALSQIDNAKAVIVGEAFFGEHDYYQSLKNLITERNLQERVIFAGHLHDVPCAMAACDIVVHASTHAEPFGLVIVEAMLCGKPVIASDAGGAREIIINGECGFLTATGDDHALANAIKTYLDNPARAKVMATKGKARAAEEFSNDTMIAEFKSLLEQAA